MADKPILNLDDLSEPGGTIVMRGATHNYVRWSALSLLERHKLTRVLERMRELEELKKPAKKDGIEYDAVVVEILGLITDIPPGTVETMTHDEREDCISFFLAVLMLRKETKKDQMAAMLSTSENSLPDSTVSGPKRTRVSGSRSPVRS